MLGDIGASLVRTFTMLVVGWLGGWAASRGFDVDTEQLSLAVGGVVTFVWYTLVRVLETRLNSNFGWLLGYARQPVYVSPPAAITSDDGTRVVRDPEAGWTGDPIGVAIGVVVLLILVVLLVKLAGGSISF